MTTVEKDATLGMDQVQIFDVAEALKERDVRRGRVDMATSPNCYIAVFQTAPRGGETHVHSHPDSDQIFFVLKGECTVESLEGRYTLTPHQGVLVPAGVNYGFTNLADEDLIFLSMRTESTGGRRVGYVPNVPSEVKVRLPGDAFTLKGRPGKHIFVYAMDRQTIGISHLLLEDWNKGSLLRMNCSYEWDGTDVVATLPERVTQWYHLQGLTDDGYGVLPEPDGRGARVDISALIKKSGA